MTALRLLNTESQDKADYLHNQLITDINVPSTYWECAESYLKGVGIYDVFLIEEQDFRNYKIFLRETGNFTKKQVFERTGFLRNLKKTLIQEEYKELLDEIEQCNTVQERLKGNVRNFLIRQGIHHVKEIDYRIRELYESELRRTKTSSKGLEYLKTLDRIKQFDIRKEMETLSGRNKERLKYEGQVIFLPYIPDQDIASDFDYIQDKSELVWDFSQKAPETLKKQIFQILCYALRNIKDSKDRRVRYLLPLRWMYEFCVEEGIDDIERLELEQIKKLETIVARKVANVKNSMQIVDNSRKILFMSGKEIHWYANVWYMERFNFAPERVNPSNPVQRLSFYEVTNERNRELLQEYMKYQVGIGDLALGNIRNQLCYIKKFLVYFNTLESICEITEEQMGMKYDKMIAVNKAESEQKIKKAIRAIDDMSARGMPISVTELVRWTGLSRGFFYKNMQVRQRLEEAVKLPRRIDVQQPSEETNVVGYNFQELKKDFNRCQSENQRLKVENEQLLQKCSILQKEVDTLKKRLDRKEIALLKKL